MKMPEIHAQGLFGCWIYTVVATENDGERIIVQEGQKCELPEHADVADDFPAGIAIGPDERA